MKRLLLSLLTLAAFTACGPKQPETWTKHRIDNVQAVYYHQSTWYSVAYLENSEVRVMNFTNDRAINETTILADVPETKPMYVEYEQTRWSTWTGNKTRAFIHIHKIADLNTSGWTLGKGGHGQTTTIEK